MGEQEQIAADFFPGSKKEQPWVRVYRIEHGHRSNLYDGPCENKRHARQIAAGYNATPWNF